MKVYLNEEVTKETPKTLTIENQTYTYIEYETEKNHSGIILPLTGNPEEISIYGQLCKTWRTLSKEKTYDLTAFASIAQHDKRMDVFQVMGFYFSQDVFIFQEEKDAIKPLTRLEMFLKAIHSKA